MCHKDAQPSHGGFAWHRVLQPGVLLMMVDVPKDRVDEIEELVKRHHPEAEIEGTEPTTIPPFP
jgi:hypothetical protein